MPILHTIFLFQIPYQIYQNPENQTQTIQGATNQAPLDIFLLHQQYPVQNTQTQQNNIAGDITQYTNAPHSYNIQHTQNNPTTEQTVNPLIKTTNKENDNPNNSIITPIVQVFKDHNCTNEDIEEIKQYEKTTYEVDDNFGAKETPLYKAAADFKIETRSNTNNEGYYYYSTEITPTTRNYYEDQEGISKLVASTQDLITNDDLLTINHSAEKQVFDIDDYIKPYNLKTEESRNNRNKHQITLKAKIRNIERSIPNSDTNYKILQNNHENKFSSPIVVKDSSYDDYKEGILDTLVSTMTPYIENGYVISSIQKNESKNAYLPHYFNEETVYVTPRPIGQKYLAPITVALRLLNSNNTDIFNTIDDPDTSDSEFVEEKVIPSKERTIVEIQESIPLDITHINEVEVHQYLENGRSKYPTNEGRNLHSAYNDQQFKGNHVNYQVSDEYDKKNNEKANGNSNYGNKVKNNDGNEKIESSENVETQVTVEFNSFKENKHNKDNNNDDVFGKRNNRKVIQPIIVEKEIPVPQYIDRYIEKQIPNSEPKVKHVPIDRPVVIPVPYEKIVEKPVEVTKYIDKPYPVEVPQPYPVPIKVPYPVEKKVYVDRPVHIPYPIEKIVEKEVVRNVPVPTPVAVPVKVQVPVEKPVIVPIPVERPYPVPVEKPVEKIVEKPVHINVPVPIPIHIIKHYPVDRIVEKKVPYPVKVEPTIVTKYIENPYNDRRTENMPYIIQSYTVDNSKPEESQNHPQYQNAEQNKAEKSQTYNQLQGNLKDKQQFTYTVPIQTTQWGSLYASSYKYINIKPHQAKNNQIYNKYLTTNQNIYYGPPPLATYNNYWENYKRGVTNRFERQPKVANLRIEYGFKPPLIPSIEVDLDGRPINRD